MKMTLVIDDESLITDLATYARWHGISVSRAAIDLIRGGLPSPEGSGDKTPVLPTFHCGAFRVEIGSRAALYEVLEDRGVRR